MVKTLNSNINKTEPGIKVKAETANKIGLFGAISVIFGSMVGVGIFLKNKGVFSNNNGHPIGVILSWVLVFIIALCTAFSYGEISRAKVPHNSGLGGWSSRYIGNRFGRFIKIMYPLIYYSIYVFVMSMFFAESIFNINPDYATSSINGINFWMIILIGFGLSILIISSIVISESLVTKSLGLISLIKFLPITLVIVCGVVCGIINPENNLFVSEHVDKYTKDFDLFGIFNSLPAIMFAFDSFLIVGNISDKLENAEKNLPLSIILSMVISGSLYFFVTIGQLFSGCGTPYELFNVLLKGNEGAIKICTILMSIFMAIALLGCTLSLTMAGVKSFAYAIDEETLFASKWFKKISNKTTKSFGAAIYLFIILIMYFLLVSIPSGILQTDKLYDGISNAIVVFAFILYGIVALSSVVNYELNKVPTSEVNHQKGQIPTSIIGFLGCILVPLWSLGYTFGYDAIKNSGGEFKIWGLFYDNKDPLEKWSGSLIFWGFSIFLFIIPFINDFLISLTDHNYKQLLLWQKEKSVKISKNKIH